MKFHNCILINFVRHARTHGRAESNMPLQLFKSWGHNKYGLRVTSCMVLAFYGLLGMRCSPSRSLVDVNEFLILRKNKVYGLGVGIFTATVL